MKKKVKVAPTNPFYTTEPAVSRSKMASNPMVPSTSLANSANKFVDKKPGRMSGIAGFVSKARPHTKPSGIKIATVKGHRLGSRSK